jgi:hypothetical protein
MELKIGDITVQVKSWNIDKENMNESFTCYDIVEAKETFGRVIAGHVYMVQSGGNPMYLENDLTPYNPKNFKHTNKYFIERNSYKPIKSSSESHLSFVYNGKYYDKKHVTELNKEESKEYERLQKEFPPGTRVISTSGIEMIVSCILYNFKNFMVSGNYTFPVSNVTKVEENMDNKYDFKVGDVVQYIGEYSYFLKNNNYYAIQSVWPCFNYVLIDKNWFRPEFFKHANYYVCPTFNLGLESYVPIKIEKETVNSYVINGKEYKKDGFDILTDKQGEEYERLVKKFVGKEVRAIVLGCNYVVKRIQFQDGEFYADGFSCQCINDVQLVTDIKD